MALTITRRRGERLLIGKDIEILVTRVSGGQVRLVVKAPPDVPIIRDELLARIRTKAESAR
jgi:carbon storage regulator